MTMTPPAGERVSSDVRASPTGGLVEGQDAEHPGKAPAADASASGAPAKPGPELRTVLAGGLVVGMLAVLMRVAASPLSNTDTYFHLRFGSEFLHRLVAARPGLGHHVRDAVLAARPSGCPRW